MCVEDSGGWDLKRKRPQECLSLWRRMCYLLNVVEDVMYLVDRIRFLQQSSLNIPIVSLCQISLDSFFHTRWSDSIHRRPENKVGPTTCFAGGNKVLPYRRKCISGIHAQEDLRCSGKMYWSENKGLHPLYCAQCLIHDQVAQLPLTVEEFQPLGPQATLGPTQPRRSRARPQSCHGISGHPRLQ